MSARLRLLLAAALLLGAAAWAAVGVSRLEVDSDLDSLLPADDPAVQALDAMARHFGGDPVVVLVEGGGDPLGAQRLPQLLQLEGELADLDAVVATYGPATTLNQTALRIKQMIAEISGQRDALRQAGRTRELERFEQRYGALLVQAMPAGLPTLRNENFVKSVVTDPRSGDVRRQWRHYLPAEDTVAIYLRPREGLDHRAAADLVEDVRDAVEESGAAPSRARVTVTGAPVVSVGLADRLRGEVPRLALTAFVVVALVLLLVPWTRRRLWRLSPLLVMAASTAGTLASFGWRGQPLSIGAATFLPIILGLGSYYPVYLSRPGHRRVVLAVATSSALAFAGLLLSPLPFVADLGVAVPVGLAQVVLLSLLAAWVRGRRPHPEEVATPAAGTPTRPVPRAALVATTAVAVLGAALGWAVLDSAPLRTDPQQLLAGLPSLDDAVHVEEVLGHSGEVDVRLVGDDVLTPAALAWSQAAEEAVVTRYGDRLQPVVTVGDLLSFLGEKPSAAEIRAGVAAMPEYVTTAVLSADRRQALTSYGVAWSDLADDRTLLRDVERSLPDPPAGYTVEVSGLPVAAERGYQLVDGDRYGASLIALLASAAALVVLLPRRRDALVAVAAATVATGLTVALMMAVIGALNPLTLALGALAAAVGAEFTVLLLASRRTRDPGLNRSVLLAALLSLGGYGVLLTSTLPVLRELGFALTTSVALSIGTALLFTAIRTGRAGVQPPGRRDQRAPAPSRRQGARSLQPTGGPR